MFYNDTAIYGNTCGLMCAYDFNGTNKLMFGTDIPLYNQPGARMVIQLIDAIKNMDINQLEKKQIFQDNARRLLRLPT
jgi:predicted TIM-barrel fold metal-dependent hydrolase